MKKLVVIVALGAGLYHFGPQMGLSIPGAEPDSAAVIAYKQFADAYVVNDYDAALALAGGSVATRLERRKNGPTRGMFKGRLERAHYKIVSEEPVGNGGSVRIQALQSASVSRQGMTANPNSPGSYITHEHSATLVRSGSRWRVIEFSDQVVSKR